MILDIVWMRVGLCVGLVGFLVAGQLPAASAQSDPAGFDMVINAPPTIIGADDSIGSNTQLNVFDDPNVDVEVGTGFNLGSALGGSTNVELNLFSGVVDSAFGFGSSFNANFGSTTNILGGSLGAFAEANSGSVVNISGGTVGMFFGASTGSVVNVSGGSVGPRFDAFAGSEVNVSGGTLGVGFDARPGSNVTFIGGEFLLNGVAPVNPASVTLSGSDVLTGTLQDGSVFVFSPVFVATIGDDLSGVTLQPGVLPANNLLPIVVDNALDVPPSGLRAGQSLTLRGDGALGRDFASVDATLTIEGGSVASNAEVVNSSVAISDGEVASLSAFSGSEINLSGGDVGLLSFFASSAEISGGALGGLTVGFGSVVDSTGGNGGDTAFVVFDGGTVNASGGTIGRVDVRSGGELNLFVTEAFIDDVPIDDLSLGESRTILERDVISLSGLLADGSEFNFGLLPFKVDTPSEDPIFLDFVDASATVTVTLVSPVLLGDVNQDEVVSFEDIPSFIEVLQAGIFLPEADCNQDGEVSFSDIPAFIAILQAQ